MKVGRVDPEVTRDPSGKSGTLVTSGPWVANQLQDPRESPLGNLSLIGHQYKTTTHERSS
ncbi:hypothetical protein PGT21_027859 [Puccinia graminis f. sp. tritici]|uniref:Uncharacterized protein n=1 Tax=Puccinia graminis f. sp. tritici TaxID=56615 RepID=A0A5B0NP42_PUCGR|nr:hypothetical protein PGT21_027859 [Puccinia graminis f. sp. tritici]